MDSSSSKRGALEALSVVGCCGNDDGGWKRRGTHRGDKVKDERWKRSDGRSSEKKRKRGRTTLRETTVAPVGTKDTAGGERSLN